MKTRLLLLALLVLTGLESIPAQKSVARQWNEIALEGIRNDFARPTVHARNLWNISMAMYDAWATYDTTARNYLLGNTIRNFTCPFEPIAIPEDVKAAQEEAMSYAVYRIMRHRFRFSPGRDYIRESIDSLMQELGYDPDFESTDYQIGPPAALGNYIGQQIIGFGFNDGSNELEDYTNFVYQPKNDPLLPTDPGNPTLGFPDHWQPIRFDTFIDQGGNPIPGATPAFLSPEWGMVTPFALSEQERNFYDNDLGQWSVYHDPGPPAYLDSFSADGWEDDYKWNFAMVAVWQSHHDPEDGVMIDISPASLGNMDISNLPTTISGLRDFYDFFEGGDKSEGREINPRTGEAYEPQFVPRGDYARVLAEFWADGPDSETPPGHWFVIMNYVMDHPEFERRYRGTGPELDTLEWDVKAYFALGGAMHDAAVSAWSVKGYYDYVRPISAIRGMADRGQSSDPELPNYDPSGMPLIPGYIELIDEDDPLVGDTLEHLNKIKLYTWRGPDFIEDPDTSVAGVGWIRAENWWPYQRPTFITPPFAGYVSGHSTYSRAAAELLTLLTGDEYFPGGMGEFEAPMNEFLVFEDGPSQDLTLQWATYRDASDQTSLSRIWGGIHPPVDDIPGRLMGAVIGMDAFDYADCYFRQPQYMTDTLTFPCSPAYVELSLDEFAADHWSWTVSDNPNISGGQDGMQEGPLVLLDTLELLSDTTSMITYTIEGSLLQCESVKLDIVYILEKGTTPVAEFDAIIEDTLVTFANLSSDATSYLWNFGDGTTDTTANPMHIYPEGGEYEVILIATNECGADTFEIVVQISTSSIGEVVASNEYFTISPNPTSGSITLGSDELRGEIELKITTTDGRLVENRKLETSGNLTVDLSSLNPGIYFAIIENDDVREVLKLVVL